MGYATSVSLGSLTIEASSIRLKKVPGSRGQKIGGRWVVKPLPDRSNQDWRGTIRGSFSDSNRNTDRDTLQTMYDNLNEVGLVDGLHDGQYILLDLEWLDDFGHPNEHRYVITIKEEK